MPVSNIICRFEPGSGPGKVKVYIMTLGVLASYRRLGLAGKLLDNLIESAGPGKVVALPDPEAPLPKIEASKDEGHKKPPMPTKDYTVEAIYLNVQTNNENARTFYEKHDFQLKEQLPTYYKEGIMPRSAWVLELR